jgi:protein-S-isoprenylcysteine O-methyltransferase Ste14
MNKLARKTIFGLILLFITLAILIFFPAWTFSYWQAWVFLFVFVVCDALIAAYLWKKDPKLLKRRMKAGLKAEKRKNQKIIILLIQLVFILMIVLLALDHRYRWSQVPLPVVIIGDILIALSFYILFIVFRENTFSASTIEVTADQKVISTGPYAKLRHPMYSGALIMFFGIPLALGSWWGLLIVVPFALLIIWRLLDEEKFLSENLEGYKEYCRKVRFRLIPFIW